MLNDVVTGVAHHNDMTDIMADISQLTGHSGSQLRNDFRRRAALALQCQTQFAHDVGTFEGDLPRNRVGHLRFKALRNVCR